MTRVDDDAMKVAKEVGTLVADMHNSNIVHGDLTTSESVHLFGIYVRVVGILCVLRHSLVCVASLLSNFI